MSEVAEPSPATAPRSTGRDALAWASKTLVSGGLLYVLLRQVDIGEVWLTVRTASPAWLSIALGIFFLSIIVSAWRWHLLTRAQHLAVRFPPLLRSYLVASFFNNFLPSNIGGDVVRVRDTARQAGSKTLATTIVLVDRGLGLLGLVFVAAVGSTMAARMSDQIGPLGPGLLWTFLGVAVALAATALMMPNAIATLLRPLRALHQEWVEERIRRLTTGLSRFGDAPAALSTCLFGAIVVQGLLVLFYYAISTALSVHVPLAHLAIVVPVSFLMQMLPISVNGFGVRETTFVVYLAPLGVPREAALALSLVGAALIMLFSVTGAVAYLGRRR